MGRGSSLWLRWDDGMWLAVVNMFYLTRELPNGIADLYSHHARSVNMAPQSHTFDERSPKRKRIEFVPARSTSRSVSPPAPRQASNAAALYTSIVLPNTAPQPLEDANASPSCPICHVPIPERTIAPQTPHEALLIHQLHLPSSAPPSALDRSSKGLAYMAAYGWDPDDRKGLGTQGEGRRYPIVARERAARVALGALGDEASKKEGREEKAERRRAEGQKGRLHAGEVRNSERSKKVGDQRLKMLIFGDDWVNEMLGLRP